MPSASCAITAPSMAEIYPEHIRAAGRAIRRRTVYDRSRARDGRGLYIRKIAEMFPARPSPDRTASQETQGTCA